MGPYDGHIYKQAMSLKQLKERYSIIKPYDSKVAYLKYERKIYEKKMKEAKEKQAKYSHSEYKNDKIKDLNQRRAYYFSIAMLGSTGAADVARLDTIAFTKKDWDDRIINPMQECIDWIDKELDSLNKSAAKNEAYVRSEIDEIFDFTLK
jgi:hypothetical protein